MPRFTANGYYEPVANGKPLDGNGNGLRASRNFGSGLTGLDLGCRSKVWFGVQVLDVLASCRVVIACHFFRCGLALYRGMSTNLPQSFARPLDAQEPFSTRRLAWTHLPESREPIVEVY